MVRAHRAAAAALVPPALLLTWTLAVGAGPARAPATGASGAANVRVVFSGELHGQLTPCGCSTPMLGGLPRRATWLRTVDPANTSIRLENGDLTMGQGRQDEIKAETIVDVLSALKYDAIVPGERDFAQGLPFLQSLQARFRGAMLCAGARDSRGKLLFPEIATVTRRAAGRSERIAVVGLLSKEYADAAHQREPSVTFDPPEATLAHLEPRIRAAGSWRILVFHGRRQEARKLVERFPLFDVVLCAHDADPDPRSLHVGRAVLLDCGEAGKQMGLAELTRGKDAVVRAAALGPEYADDPVVAAMKRAYLDRVTAENLIEQVPRSPTENGDAFAGSAACRSCHAESYRVWSSSAHAHALATLAAVGEDRDPECAQCHVVGLDRVGGFASAQTTPDLANVGCESCHGPAAKHGHDPSNRLPLAGSDSCAQCHVSEHSPRFDFPSYWQRIKH